MDTFKNAYQKPEPFIATVVDLNRKLDGNLLAASWESGGKRIVPLPILDAKARTFSVPESLQNRRLRLFVPETYSEKADAATVVCTHRGRELTEWFRDVSDMPPEITTWFSPDQGYTAFTVRARASHPRVIIRNHAISAVAGGTITIIIEQLANAKINFFNKTMQETYEKPISAAHDKACNRERDLAMTASDPRMRISYYHKTIEPAPA